MEVLPLVPALERPALDPFSVRLLSCHPWLRRSALFRVANRRLPAVAWKPGFFLADCRELLTAEALFESCRT